MRSVRFETITITITTTITITITKTITITITIIITITKADFLPTYNSPSTQQELKVLKNACISGLAHSYQALDAPTSHDATSFQFDEKEVTFRTPSHKGSGRVGRGRGENDTEYDLTESDWLCDEIDHLDSSPSSPRPPVSRKLVPRDSGSSMSNYSFSSTLSEDVINVSPQKEKEKEKEKEKKDAKRMSNSLKKTMHNYLLLSPSQSSPTLFSQVSPLPPSFLDHPKSSSGRSEKGEKDREKERGGGGEGGKGKGKGRGKASSSVGHRGEAEFLLPPPSFSFTCEDVKSITMFVVCLFPHWNTEISNFLASFAQFGISEVS